MFIVYFFLWISLLLIFYY